jgi:hypothetical protein
MKWQVGLLAGALALGSAWCTTTAQAQDAQNAGAQQDGQGRRGRGQGGGAGGGLGNPVQAVERQQTAVMALDLKEDQKTKLQAIFKDAGEQAKTLQTEVESLQGRERMEKLQPFNRDLREKVQAVLTDEQKQTLRKNQATQQAKQMTDRYRRTLGELGLSDDQKTKVEAVLTESEKKMTEAAAQATADGQGGGQGGGRGGPFGEINRDTREKITALLTDEQKTKFEEANRGRGQGGGRRGGQQQN